MWKNKPGYFLTLEGPDGCGKTTQIPQLAEHLRGLGLNVLTTREPGGTDISDQIRQIIMNLRNTAMDPRTETLLFQAARAQIVSEVFRPNLELGHIIISDRYADSTLAYQGFGHGQDIEEIHDLILYATNGLTPDLTVLFDIDAAEGLKRRQQSRGEWNRLDAAELDFHNRVREGYLNLVKAEPDRWIVIDASKGIDEVRADLKEKIEERLISDGFMEGNRRSVER
jgi:dTMP kinase